MTTTWGNAWIGAWWNFLKSSHGTIATKCSILHYFIDSNAIIYRKIAVNSMIRFIFCSIWFVIFFWRWSQKIKRPSIHTNQNIQYRITSNGNEILFETHDIDESIDVDIFFLCLALFVHSKFTNTKNRRFLLLLLSFFFLFSPSIFHTPNNFFLLFSMW